MQNKPAENRRALSRNEPAPDLTDFMNDWFFGATNAECGNGYNLTGTNSDKEEEYHDDDDDEDGILTARNSASSRKAQEWLEEAKRIVAVSPARVGSPSRLVGSPRFASERAGVPSAVLDHRDPLSRSARRYRSVENFSGEILSKTAKHTHNNSESFESQQQRQRQLQITEKPPAASVQHWLSNILKLEPKKNQEDMSDELNSVPKPPAQKLHPPRQPVHRKSRFQDEVPNSQIAAKSVPTRAFQTTSVELENPVLSPPKHLIESVHRRSISSSTCSLDRLSRSNAEVVVKVGPKLEPGQSKEDTGVGWLNLFLREKKSTIEKISKGEVSTKAKIILSSSANSTSSMVAAICYAWLLENKKEEDVVVPVMNLKRERMWKQRQAAWLFYHVGIDANALLFSDEVDLESLILGNRLSILVVGQDILKTTGAGEVGSQCTVLTDNYCEDAYELLHMPYMKNLLLAGILLDTQNLSTTAKISKSKDAEAVQLLLVGTATNRRLAFYSQRDDTESESCGFKECTMYVMQDQRDSKFLHALTCNYGKPSHESDDENEAPRDYRVSRKKSMSSTQQVNAKTPSDTKITIKQAVSTKSSEKKPSAKTAAMPIQTQAIEAASRGKGKFSFVRWLGFGSKQ